MTAPRSKASRSRRRAAGDDGAAANAIGRLRGRFVRGQPAVDARQRDVVDQLSPCLVDRRLPAGRDGDPRCGGQCRGETGAPQLAPCGRGHGSDPRERQAPRFYPLLPDGRRQGASFDVVEGEARPWRPASGRHRPGWRPRSCDPRANGTAVEQQRHVLVVAVRRAVGGGAAAGGIPAGHDDPLPGGHHREIAAAVRDEAGPDRPDVGIVGVEGGECRRPHDVADASQGPHRGECRGNGSPP